MMTWTMALAVVIIAVAIYFMVRGFDVRLVLFTAGIALCSIPRRIVLADAKPGRADRHHQLHLVVVVVGLGRISHRGAGLDECRRRLGEVEGPLVRLVAGLAHLDRMCVVVAADEEEAVDRKALGLAANRERVDGGRGTVSVLGD